MNIVDIILKKRNDEALSKEEIDFFVQGYTEGIIPDYQISSLLMAIYFQKMTREETAYLTESMMNSGQLVNLTKIDGIKVDKHSTGGVGDKTTIALGAMVAACGVPVAKMSGRGLGHTGGTIDKLESIPGFSVELSIDEFIKNVNNIKIAVMGQTNDLAPADKKLYSLRDVTGTVDNISLIASSIMSKKLAAGADAILLDVKTGNGAFMKDLDSSFELGKEMVSIGNKMNRDTIAIVTDMDQPLGLAIGNSLEVKEAVETLRGNGPQDFTELCETLGAYMLLLAQKVLTVEEGREKIQESVKSGEALRVFKVFISSQGGDVKYINNTDLLPKSNYVYVLRASETGFISQIKAMDVGVAASHLGAGRETKDSIVDLSVGVVLDKKVGDLAEKGEVLAYIHYNDEIKRDLAVEKLVAAFKITKEKPITRPLIYGIVHDKGIEKNK
ncbi:MAG: pyrimidine-nucleoside phosphorylase [Clostridiales bacterium]|nr:pyrimidine-nucleoside phosphorylase [Clostridiales bacterium]